MLHSVPGFNSLPVVFQRFLKGLIAAGVGASAAYAVTFFQSSPEGVSELIAVVAASAALAIEKWAQRFALS